MPVAHWNNFSDKNRYDIVVEEIKEILMMCFNNLFEIKSLKTVRSITTNAFWWNLPTILQMTDTVLLMLVIKITPTANPGRNIPLRYAALRAMVGAGQILI